MSHKKRHDAASIRPRRSRWDVGQVISTKRNRRDRSDPRVASREEGLEVVGVERGAHHILEDVEEELVAHAVDRALELAPRRRRQRVVGLLGAMQQAAPGLLFGRVGERRAD